MRLLEQAEGVGGTWYWNRYPGCRFDSESYTYGYLFSEELWQEWDWSEEFAPQPETERYLNHVVDKFDLRRHIRFSSKVTSAVWDEDVDEPGRPDRGRVRDPRRGTWSPPPACCRCRSTPTCPAARTSAGETYHPVRWPKEPVDFRGKRVAVIGTGSTGVQIGPAIADEVESLVMYQRTATWATPLNNHPIDGRAAGVPQGELRADQGRARRLGRRLPAQAGRQEVDRGHPGAAAGVLRDGLEQPRVREDQPANYDDLLFNRRPTPTGAPSWRTRSAGSSRTRRPRRS